MGIMGAIYCATPAEVLDQLPDNRARAAYCAKQAKHYRDKFWAGQREAVSDLQMSTDRRYFRRTIGRRYRAVYPEAVLARIAQKKWSNSAMAEDCRKNEQMWRGFADHFMTMSQLDRVEL